MHAVALPLKVPQALPHFTPRFTGQHGFSPQAMQALAANLRQHALRLIFEAQSGHPGSSFSCQDLLAQLWFNHLRHDPSEPNWAERDRFVLSKGHAAPALYAVLAACGYYNPATAGGLRQVHSTLQGHPASRYLQGVDVSTGSLGQGLSAAVGMALGLRLKEIDARVWAVLGDGESQEGNVWEAVMSAAQHQTAKLTAVIDRNRLQIDGETEAIKGLGNMAEKFKAFGWQVLEVDGHDFAALKAAFEAADANAAALVGPPTCIIAHTVKGQGVSFMENQVGWHGKAPNAQQFEAAMNELQATQNALPPLPEALDALVAFKA